MKNLRLIVFCLFFTSVFSCKQTDNQPRITGKWIISETTADGKPLNKDELKKIKVDKNYMVIKEDGKIQIFSEGINVEGTWEYADSARQLAVTITPTKEERANNISIGTIKYTVSELTATSLTLRLGTYVTSKYLKKR